MNYVAVCCLEEKLLNLNPCLKEIPTIVEIYFFSYDSEVLLTVTSRYLSNLDGKFTSHQCKAEIIISMSVIFLYL